MNEALFSVDDNCSGDIFYIQKKIEAVIRISTQCDMYPLKSDSMISKRHTQSFVIWNTASLRIYFLVAMTLLRNIF